MGLLLKVIVLVAQAAHQRVYLEEQAQHSHHHHHEDEVDGCGVERVLILVEVDGTCYHATPQKEAEEACPPIFVVHIFQLIFGVVQSAACLMVGFHIDLRLFSKLCKGFSRYPFKLWAKRIDIFVQRIVYIISHRSVFFFFAVDKNFFFLSLLKVFPRFSFVTTNRFPCRNKSFPLLSQLNFCKCIINTISNDYHLKRASPRSTLLLARARRGRTYRIFEPLACSLLKGRGNAV